MKTYRFPKSIRLKPRKKTTYIRREKGFLSYNCKPEEATEVKEVMVSRSFRWPVTVLIIVRGEKDRLLDVLFYCGWWFYHGHDVYISWNGLFGRSFKCLAHFRIPYRWWTWKVLTRSKKLVWKDKTLWMYG